MNLQTRKHHYVPQLWIRRFKNASGVLYKWDGAKCSETGTKAIMQLEWLNTTYNHQWQASNKIETRLSGLEGIVSKLFSIIEDVLTPLEENHRTLLCQVLALQACRHPDVFMAGHRKAGRLADLFAKAPQIASEGEFASAATEFGISLADAAQVYKVLHHAQPKELEAQCAVVRSMSPQDVRLPMTDALRAIDPIAASLLSLSFDVIEAPNGCNFILGDTPLPQSELSKGFVVPLSKALAIKCYPPALTPQVKRRSATVQEVEDCNRQQWEMAAVIVVGPDRGQLEMLGKV